MAHNYFEQVWCKIRTLDQGLIQLCAACLHLQRVNLNGAHNLLRRAQARYSCHFLILILGLTSPL